MRDEQHISDEISEAYANRTLGATEFLAVQTHLDNCGECRERIAQTAGIAAHVNALASQINSDWLTADEPEHLPYEQLALYLDGKLDEVDREISDSHLFVCAQCTTDLADLRKYQKIAAPPVVQVEIQPAARAAKTKKERQSLWQRIFGGGFTPAFASALAILLIAVLIGGWFLIRFNQNEPQIAQSNINQIASPSPIASFSPVNGSVSANTATTPNAVNANSTNQPLAIPPVEPLFALNDGAVTVDENGEVRGLENLSPAAQKAVRQSLQTGKVIVSPNVSALGGGGGVLMSGGADSGVPFALQTPVGRVVRETQPVLRWKPLKDATAYSAAIVDDNFRIVADSGKLTQTSWKPPKQLPRGKNYSWQVTAILPDGGEIVSPASPAPQARFRVLDAAANNDLSQLENAKSKSRLALGVLYAQNGLTAEARREFEILVRENPRSAAARRLLNGVRK